MSSSIGLNPTVLSTTCDKILSWMIEILMNTDSVSGKYS